MGQSTQKQRGADQNQVQPQRLLQVAKKACWLPQYLCHDTKHERYPVGGTMLRTITANWQAAKMHTNCPLLRLVARQDLTAATHLEIEYCGLWLAVLLLGGLFESIAGRG
jgi:hypothetical protein